MKNYLNFESEIKNIENEIEKLKDPFNKEGISQVDTKKIDKLEKDLEYKIKNIYSKMTREKMSFFWNKCFKFNLFYIYILINPI